MQFKHCTLEIDGPVATLTLDHQEVMNAVSVDMLGGLQEALNHIEQKRDEVRCVVMTGAGRAFCTGANLQGRQRQPGEPQRRFDAGDRVPSVPAAAAQTALPAGHLGERTCGRRRHELCADGRPHPVREVGVFPAGVPPHRPRAGLRLDLDVAAAGRQGARGRAVDARRAAAGREGAGVGPRHPRVRRRAVRRRDEEAGARTRQRPDHRAGADPRAVLEQRAQLVRGAARRRSAGPEAGRCCGRFPRGRVGVPGKAPAKFRGK